MRSKRFYLNRTMRFTAVPAILICGLFLLASCSTPSYPSSDAEENIAKKTLTTYDAVTVNKVDAALGSDFIRGMDASMVYALEKAGATYYNEDGTETDVLAIMKKHGVNWIRLRVWNDPRSNTEIPAGENDLVRTKAIAKRAKDLGMKVLVDFHYSDTWADPDSQETPTMWSAIDTIGALATAVNEYTYEAIEELIDAGATPDMVQIGNEIDSGLFLTGGKVTAKVGTSNLSTVLNAASSAVRLAAPGAKVMIHLSRGGNASLFTSFFNNYATHSGTAATVAAVDFDVIGLSYYPYYASHGTLAKLAANMVSLKSVYGKDVVIAETSYGWTTGYGDSTSNIFYTSQETQAYTNLAATGNASDFVIGSDGASIPASIQNQANVIRAVIQATAESGGLGIFYWGGDWIPADGIGDSWENQALFDFDGVALPSLNVFSVKGTE